MPFQAPTRTVPLVFWVERTDHPDTTQDYRICHYRQGAGPKGIVRHSAAYSEIGAWREANRLARAEAKRSGRCVWYRLEIPMWVPYAKPKGPTEDAQNEANFRLRPCWIVAVDQDGPVQDDDDAKRQSASAKNSEGS